MHRSAEWTSVPGDVKNQVGLVKDHDGEFWYVQNQYLN